MWALTDFTGVLKYKNRAIGSAFVVNGSKGYIATCKHLLDEIAHACGAPGIREVPDCIGHDELTFHLGGTGREVPTHFISASLNDDVALLGYSPGELDIPFTPPLLEYPPAGSEVVIGGYAVFPDNSYSAEWFSAIGKIAGDYIRKPLQGGALQYLLHLQGQAVIKGMSGAPVVIQDTGIVGIQSERYYPPSEDGALQEARWVVPVKALVELAPEDLQLTTFTRASSTETEIAEALSRDYIDFLLRRIQSDLEKTIPLTGETNSSFLSLNPEFELLTIQDHLQNLSIQRESIDDIVDYILSKSLLRIAIVGPSGCGKTTTLNLIARQYCSLYKAGDSAIIPVFVNLSGYHLSDTARIDDYIRQQLPSLTPLAEHLKRYILLIDAFDELSVVVQDALIDYLDRSVSCNFVIGCRSSHQNRIRAVAKLRLVEILPLNEVQIRSYIRWYLGPQEAEKMFWELAGDDIRELYQQWQRTLAPLDEFWRIGAEVPTNFPWDLDRRRRKALLKPPPLLEMARNPYMLRMLITTYSNQQRLSVNKGTLMRDFVRVLIRRGQLQDKTEICPIGDIEAGLGSLAYSMIDKELLAVSDTLGLQAIEVNQPMDYASYSLKIAIRGGVIDQEGDLLRFRHSMLRSYLAAIELEKRIVSDETLTTYIPAHTWWEQNRWTEVFTFIPALHGSSERLARWLKDIQPELAAQALCEDKENPLLNGMREELRRSILQRLDSSHGSVPLERSALGRALGLIGDSRRGVSITPTHALPDIEWVFIPKPKKDAQLPISKIKPFYISRYPITNEQYASFLHSRDYKNAIYWTRRGRDLRDRYKWYYPKNYGYPFDLGNHPVVGVSWHESQAFCNWLSKQTGTVIKLPSIWQWMIAAQSSQGIVGLPWGSSFDPAKCNARESGIGSTTAVGLFPEGQSQNGLQDCGGNVWEYCLPGDRNQLTKPRNEIAQALKALLKTEEEELYVPIKGGSFTHFKRCLLIEHNIYAKDTDREWDIGFRLVKEL